MMAEIKTIRRQIDDCVTDGNPKNICLISVIDRLIADEQLAQKQYADFLNFVPPTTANLQKVSEIKNDEADHERILRGIKAEFEAGARERFVWRGKARLR